MESKPPQSPLLAKIDQSASAMGAPIADADCQPHHIYRWITKDRAAEGKLYHRLWSSARKRWKGGTAKGGAICFVTLTERFSRLFSASLLRRKTAGPVSAAMVEMLRKVQGKLHTDT